MQRAVPAAGRGSGWTRVASMAVSIALGTMLLTVVGVEAARPIRIGLSPWPGWYAWYLVEEKGFFTKHGVDVELVWFPAYSDSLQALATGQIDANSQTLSDTLAPLALGIPLRAVLVNDNSAGGDALVAKPGIAGVKELRGKRVATELGTVDHLLLLVALERHGMTEKDINFINMAVNDAGPAFIAGRLDAAVLWEPFRSQAVEEGRGRVLFSSADTPGLVPDLLVVQERVADQRRDEVVRIVAAWFDAMAYWRANPKEVVPIMARRAETPVDIYEKLLAGVRIFTIADNRKAFQKADDYSSLYYSGQRTAEFLRNLRMLPRIPRFTERVFDVSYVEAAQQLLEDQR